MMTAACRGWAGTKQEAVAALRIDKGRNFLSFVPSGAHDVNSLAAY
jgi:hypothetical protein